jgi:hypothetical protein
MSSWSYVLKKLSASISVGHRMPRFLSGLIKGCKAANENSKVMEVVRE